jgi:hypothetical protein
MKNGLFELSVVVPARNGFTKIPEFGLENLTLVEGRRGQKYAIRLRNDSAQRVMAVVSVDGLSILDGQPCTAQSRGYVIPAYQSADIEGWRSSLETIHRFEFKAREQAYAKGRSPADTRNCGVIAVKYFSEKARPVTFNLPAPVEHHHHYHSYPVYTQPIVSPAPVPWPTYPLWPNIYGSSYETTCGNTGGNIGGNATFGNVASSASLLNAVNLTGCNVAPGGADMDMNCASAPAPARASNGKVPEFTLGTGWGMEARNVVTETAFERDAELCTLTLFYAEAGYLRQVGVVLEKPVEVTMPATPALPQAFSGFCTPPVSR